MALRIVCLELRGMIWRRIGSVNKADFRRDCHIRREICH